MKKNYGLTNTEMQIMEKFWEEKTDIKHLFDKPSKNGFD